MGDLSEHFSKHEFACKCGCGYFVVEPELITKLELMRKFTDQPILIHRGCSCPAHNKAVGGKDHSYHLTGKAADIEIMNTSLEDMVKFAKLAGFVGIGQYPDHVPFIHVDTRIVPTFWRREKNNYIYFEDK